MRALVTAPHGKLAQTVIPILRAEGIITIPFGSHVDLSREDDVTAWAKLISTPVDAVVSLVGTYVEGDSKHAHSANYLANVQAVTTPMRVLRKLNRLADFPTLVAIGSPFDSTLEQRLKAPEYYASKAVLKQIWQEGDPSRAYWYFLEPAGAIDTEEKREDIAFRILDAVTLQFNRDEVAYEA